MLALTDVSLALKARFATHAGEKIENCPIVYVNKDFIQLPITFKLNASNSLMVSKIPN